MSLTEQKLWQKLSVEVVLPDLLTRIETETRVGVSDVEYVAGNWHGWVELKVAAGLKETSLLRIQHPFTLQQYTWLTLHHKPQFYLFSWLVIGRMAKRGECIMIPCPGTITLTQRQLTLAEVRNLPGAITCATPREVIQVLRRGY